MLMTEVDQRDRTGEARGDEAKVEKGKTFYHDDISKVLFTEEDIKAKLVELGARITADYKGKDLIVVGLLRGALIFLADIVRHIDLPCTIDVMNVKSYSGTNSTGTVKLIKDLDEDPCGKHILIAEDLIDTGGTLMWLQNHLKSISGEIQELQEKQRELSSNLKNSEITRSNLEKSKKYEVMQLKKTVEGLPYQGGFTNVAQALKGVMSSLAPKAFIETQGELRHSHEPRYWCCGCLEFVGHALGRQWRLQGCRFCSDGRNSGLRRPEGSS